MGLEYPPQIRSTEDQRSYLGRMTLKERRIAILASQGLEELQDPEGVAQKLNGSSDIHLIDFLEAAYERRPYVPIP